MRELMLIVTGVPRAHKAHAASGDASRLRLPWQRVDATVADIRSTVLLQVGRPDLAAVAPAALIAQARAMACHGAPWLLSPLHCVAGIDRVHLDPEGVLDLPPEQWAELCASFTRELGDAVLQLTPVDGGTALLQGGAWGDLFTLEPAELPGADLRACQPRGAGAGRWRALQGEVEMWLHGHPVNRRRAREGLPTVTTLWLWGGRPMTGAPISTASPPAAEPGGWVMVGMGAWGRALAALQSRVQVVDPAAAPDFASLAAAFPDCAAIVSLSAAPDTGHIERCWLEPAARAFGRGALDGVMLRHRDLSWRLGRRRWWRRRRDLALVDLLAASPTAAELR